MLGLPPDRPALTVAGLEGGYGESPDQGLLHFKGDRYLEESFPRLDKITAATIVEP